MKQIYLLVFGITLFAQNVFANPSCKDINKYDLALQSITTMKANFEQHVNGKYHSSGVFLLKRPEKMLIDYNKGKVNALIGVNGKLTTYLDKDLEQISHLPKDKTPVHFILNNNKKLSEMDILNCTESKNLYSVSFKQDTSVISGEFTIFFDMQSKEIKKISVRNDSGEVIELIFSNLSLGIDIPDKQFVIKDPNL